MADDSVGEQIDERRTHQARFTGTRNAGDGRQYTEWKSHIDGAQIVAGDVVQMQPATGAARFTRYRFHVGEYIARRRRFPDFLQSRQWAAVEHLAAIGAGARTDIHDPFGA